MSNSAVFPPKHKCFCIVESFCSNCAGVWEEDDPNCAEMSATLTGQIYFWFLDLQIQDLIHSHGTQGQMFLHTGTLGLLLEHSHPCLIWIFFPSNFFEFCSFSGLDLSSVPQNNLSPSLPSSVIRAVWSLHQNEISFLKTKACTPMSFPCMSESCFLPKKPKCYYPHQTQIYGSKWKLWWYFASKSSQAEDEANLSHKYLLLQTILETAFQAQCSWQKAALIAWSQVAKFQNISGQGKMRSNHEVKYAPLPSAFCTEKSTHLRIKVYIFLFQLKLSKINPISFADIINNFHHKFVWIYSTWFLRFQNARALHFWLKLLKCSSPEGI